MHSLKFLEFEIMIQTARTNKCLYVLMFVCVVDRRFCADGNWDSVWSPRRGMGQFQISGAVASSTDSIFNPAARLRGVFSPIGRLPLTLSWRQQYSILVFLL